MVETIQYRGAVYRRAAQDAARELAEALYTALLSFESAGVGVMRWTRESPWPKSNTYVVPGERNPVYFIFNGAPVKVIRDDRSVLTTRSPEWGILSDEVHAAVEAVIRAQGFRYTPGMETHQLASRYRLDNENIDVHLHLLDMNYPSSVRVRIIVETVGLICIFLQALGATND